jgi:ABC-2 type transport system ATP-binding protein
MSAALSIKSLTKIYANNFYALKAIDLSVEEGDFFALLGSNGAGKTTAIGIICGLLNKTLSSFKYDHIERRISTSTPAVGSSKINIFGW